MQLAFRFYTHTQRIGLEKLRDSARDTIFSDRLFFLLLLSVSFAIQIAQELWHWARWIAGEMCIKRERKPSNFWGERRVKVAKRLSLSPEKKRLVVGGERLSSSSSSGKVVARSEEWRATSERFGFKKILVSRNRNFSEEKSNESFFFLPSQAPPSLTASQEAPAHSPRGFCHLIRYVGIIIYIYDVGSRLDVVFESLHLVRWTGTPPILFLCVVFFFFLCRNNTLSLLVNGPQSLSLQLAEQLCCLWLVILFLGSKVFSW